MLKNSLYLIHWKKMLSIYCLHSQIKVISQLADNGFLQFLALLLMLDRG